MKIQHKNFSYFFHENVDQKNQNLQIFQKGSRNFQKDTQKGTIDPLSTGHGGTD